MTEAAGGAEGPVFEGRAIEDAEATGELAEAAVFEGRAQE